MCRKMIGLISLVFVLSLALPSPAEAAEPGLVGWWKFDGDGLDASGNGRNGTLAGDAHFEVGHSGQALALDGTGDSFSVTGWKGLLSTSAVTVTAWVKTTAGGTMVYWGRSSGGRRVDFDVNPGTGRLRVRHGNGNIQGDTAVNDGEWHHIALTMPAAAQISYPYVKLYCDGRDDTQNTTDPDAFNLVDHASNVDLTIGYRVPNGDGYFTGLIDDVRIYDRELVGAEIKDIATLGYLASPHSPTPADGAIVEDTWTTLTWTAGPLAASHKLYLSTSIDDVNAGAESAFVGNTATNSQPVGFPGFPAPGGLVPGTTYYWRIDEVNDANPQSPWKGNIWSFTVPSRKAYNPDPADGLMSVDPKTTLRWAGGFNAKVRYVYFGDKFDDVNNATGAAVQSDMTYTPAAPLEWSRTYYWRVDEFDGAITHKGDVWSFETKPFIPITDPNLAGWWTLDEGSGRTVLDWSGHGHDATFRAGETWVKGYDARGLHFATEADRVVHSLGTATDWPAGTVAVWVKADRTGQDQYSSVFSSHVPNSAGFQIDVDGGNPGYYRINPSDLRFGPVTTGWVHLAVSFQGTSAQLYYNGNWASSGALTDTTFNQFAAGTNRNATNSIAAAIDELRVYDKVLTQDEIRLVMRIDPLLAWAPSPADGSTPDIDAATPLSWSPGNSASRHDVYFGADANAVAIADASDATGIYRGRQSGTVYTPAGGVQWGGGPYYWRIDENNTDGTVTKGRVWSFTVADYLVVDDFEDYNDYPPDRIWDTWIDGFSTTTNGAVVGHPEPLDFAAGEHYVETGTVHGGSQSMPLYYNNNLKFSEATRTLASPSDWTRYGIQELSLWYIGDPCNVSERMYVAVSSSAGATAVVYVADPNLVTDTWTEWVIPLQSFADQGVNLKSVTSIALGFGTPGSTTTPGGSGVVFFDDIRLRRTPVAPAVPVVATVPPDAYDPTSVSAVQAP